MKTKDFRLDLKAVSESGSFSGYLSVYDVIDLGNDVVEKGAFTKTIQEQRGVVPLLFHHDPKIPLGSLDLTDEDVGLKVDGQFFIEESEKAREMHAMSRRFHEKGRPMGLSIGYDTIKRTVKDGIRYLKELKLYEGSITLFPMLPIAQISDIKSFLGGERKGDFTEELARLQLFSMRGLILDALYYSLDSALYGWDREQPMDAAAKLAESEKSIDQFRTAYLEHLPLLLDMWGVKAMPEIKAGRRLSAESRAEITEALKRLQALLDKDESTSDEAADSEKSGAATHEGNKPDELHSFLTRIQTGVKKLCLN